MVKCIFDATSVTKWNWAKKTSNMLPVHLDQTNNPTTNSHHWHFECAIEMAVFWGEMNTCLFVDLLGCLCTFKMRWRNPIKMLLTLEKMTHFNCKPANLWFICSYVFHLIGIQHFGSWKTPWKLGTLIEFSWLKI